MWKKCLAVPSNDHRDNFLRKMYKTEKKFRRICKNSSHHFLQYDQMLILLLDSCVKLIVFSIFEGLGLIHAIFSEILTLFTLKIYGFLSIHSPCKFSANNAWIPNSLFSTQYWSNWWCFLWFRFCISHSLSYIIDLTWNWHSFNTEKLNSHHHSAIFSSNVEKFKIYRIENMSICFQMAVHKSKCHHNHYSVRKTMENGLTKR